MSTQTLHDFTLNLLGDLDAREAFQLDPEGALEAAGLGDISPVDVQEILPLVLDSASVVKIDAIDKVLVEAGDLTAVDSLKLITGNIEGVTHITDVAGVSGVTALVTDLDGLGGITDVVAGNDVVSKVTDVVDVKNVTDVSHVVGDLDTDVLVKDVVDSDVLVKDVIGTTDVDVKDVFDVTDNLTGDITGNVTGDIAGNVIHDVAQVGDVHNDLGQVIGDVKLGDLDLLDGGIGNGNDFDLHL